MKNLIRYILIAFLFFILVLVRAFATKVFYDPLIQYFQLEYLYHPPNDIEIVKLLFHMFLRFLINTIISLMIIWLVFKQKSFVKFSIIFYTIVFVVLITTFGFLLANNFEVGYRLPFYIRRFIIHPLFLLLLLPAFYYQKLKTK